MTLEEITVREAELREQIAERQQLLAAYQLIRADRDKSVARHAGGVGRDESERPTNAQAAAPSVEATPPVPVTPEVNLQALSKGYGGGIRAVTWAIRQMTTDFTVRDIAAVLRQAECPMGVEKVSVVLNRMKRDGKIIEVTKGRGRAPSLFRATPLVTTSPLELAARHRTAPPVRYRMFR